MTSSLFTHQRHEFNNQFRSHFGDAFQEWCLNLLRHMYPSGDVHGVRLTQGDGKIDALILSEQTAFQCYGPQTFQPSKAAAKITGDFEGAHKFLEGRLQKWIFVHNHQTGSLDKECLKALNDLVSQCLGRNESIEILAWGIEELWAALEKNVSLRSLQELFGSPDPIHVTYACLESLLLTLERADYPEDAAAISQPAVNKLDFNALGPAYRREIREGRAGSGVMEEYLASRATSEPEFAERLAQRFRDRYKTLRDRPGLTSDDVYEGLRLDAGWKASPDAPREFATRVILAYFFDSCDIFENLPTEP
jgi:hypothetical protein